MQETMPYPPTILCAPLPQAAPGQLDIWRRAFEAGLEPWLDARQMEHVRRFGRAPTLVQSAHLQPDAKAFRHERYLALTAIFFRFAAEVSRC